MKCKEMVGMWEDYRDGKLTKDKAAEIREHLEKCASCREQFAVLAKVYNNMKAIEEKDVPEDLWSRIESTIDEKEARSSIFNQLFMPQLRPKLAYAAAFAAILIMVTGIYGYKTYNNASARWAANEQIAEIVVYVNSDLTWTNSNGI